jgi:hypothetical protein
MAHLYAKDYNDVNYVALTIGFYYFSKQFESIMLNNFNLNKKISKNALVFNDDIPFETTKGTMSWFVNLTLSMRNFICTAAVLFMIALHTVEILVPPPKKLPDLYVVSNNAFSFACFVFASLYAHCLM